MNKLLNLEVAPKVTYPVHTSKTDCNLANPNTDRGLCLPISIIFWESSFFGPDSSRMQTSPHTCIFKPLAGPQTCHDRKIRSKRVPCPNSWVLYYKVGFVAPQGRRKVTLVWTIRLSVVINRMRKMKQSQLDPATHHHSGSLSLSHTCAKFLSFSLSQNTFVSPFFFLCLFFLLSLFLTFCLFFTFSISCSLSKKNLSLFISPSTSLFSIKTKKALRRVGNEYKRSESFAAKESWLSKCDSLRMLCQAINIWTCDIHQKAPVISGERNGLLRQCLRVYWVGFVDTEKERKKTYCES